MLIITVHLYGKNGIRGEFKDYETKALSIFQKHGGEVVYTYVPLRNNNSVDIPDEIQVLKISNQEMFQKFMQDPERVSLAAERDSVIRKTEVFLSESMIEYSLPAH